MKLWVDDEREAPDDWVWVKNSRMASALIFNIENNVEEISLDHDLGDGDTSMPIAKFIEEQAFHGLRKPPKWTVHSANPVGKQNLEAALKKADEYWIDWMSGF
jgi:hypothetical protein